MTREEFADNIETYYRYVPHPILIAKPKDAKNICIRCNKSQYEVYKIYSTLYEEYITIDWENESDSIRKNNYKENLENQLKYYQGISLIDWLESLSDEDLEIYSNELNTILKIIPRYDHLIEKSKHN